MEKLPRGPRPSPRRLARDAAIVLALSLALLGLLEAAARVAGFAPRESHAALPDKRPGAFRIVTAGGSTVAGVPEGRLGYARQLVATLRELVPRRDVELHNLARPGADSSDVRRAVSRAVEAEPDLLVVLTGHNEFLRRSPEGPRLRLLQRLRDGSALALALERALDRVGVGASRDQSAGPERIPPVDRASADFQHRVAGFHDNLAAIVAMAREREVPLVLCTAPSNLADWPPVHRSLAGGSANPRYQDDLRRLAGLLGADRPEELIREAEALMGRYGEDAMLQFLTGRAERALGRPDRARESFLRARELDPLPWRVLPEFNDAVRAFAATPGVRVVDVERLFEERAADGLVGFELVCDNCHPTPLGNALIARAIAEAMAEQGLLLPRNTSLPPSAEWLARVERGLGGPEARRRVRARWLLSNALYAMTAPFHNREAARDYLERARAIAPTDWRVWANLGTLALLDGKLRKGRAQLRRAERLKGAPLDPDDRGSHPYLAEALQWMGARPASQPGGPGGS